MDKAFVTARLASTHFDCSRMQLRSVQGREAISQPYRFDLEVILPDPGELIESEVLGGDATIVFEKDGLELRSIHGMVAQMVDLLESESGFRSYRLEVVPHAYRMSVVETQEVFLDLAVPDIVRAKLQLVGLGARDVDMRLSGDYGQREFVVRAVPPRAISPSMSRLHRARRRLSYFFEQAGDSEKIVFLARPARAASAHRRGRQGAVPTARRRGRRLPPREARADDPGDVRRAGLQLPHAARRSHLVVREPRGQRRRRGGVRRAPYDPGSGPRAREGARRGARGALPLLRRRERRLPLQRRRTFELTDHPRLPNQRLLLVEVEHSLVQSVLTASTGKEHGYRVTFKAVDALKNYRPPRVTPKPRIAGVVTRDDRVRGAGRGPRRAHRRARLRYLVAFHFDTGSSRRSSSSRPAPDDAAARRADHGMRFPLKPDTEVLIAFVDGDPDRPIIAGAVPNAVTASPVNRANATMHTISTASGIHFIMNDTP